ncbi:MAG: peptidoglycan-binding protein, partial [Gammaproteobacteria bacterium]
LPKQRPVGLLRRLVTSRDLESALQSLVPAAAGYRGLQDALSRYRRLADNGGWPQLRSSTTLRQGMHHPQVEVLRKRLTLEGDLQDIRVSDSQKFDARVKFAVERFQVHHGLKMDGVVGTRTREATALSATQKDPGLCQSCKKHRSRSDQGPLESF